MTKEEQREQKEISYYSALVNAWITTKMEKDKTILAVSSGAIALLVSIIGTVGIYDIHELCLYVITLFLFLTTIVITTVILNKNSIYIEKVINEEDKGKPKLYRLDSVANWSFFIGISFSIIIGIISGYHSLQINKRINMETNNESERRIFESLKKKSLEGVDKLKPKDVYERIDGLENLSPKKPNTPTDSESEDGNQSNTEK